MPIINLNQANFYYELHGTGHPVILIAGYSCDHQIWLPVLEELSQHFQLLIFDNRGVGQTTDNNVPLTAKLMAEDVVALSDHLNLKKPHVVGHSMGGTIAQSMAIHWPEKMSKLCLLNTSAKWRKAMLHGEKSLISMFENNIEMDSILEAILAWVFGEAFLSNPKKVAAFKQAAFENPYPQSLNDQLRQFNVLKAFDEIAGIQKIAAPTLIVSGIEDILSLPSESAYLAKQIPQATLVQLETAHGSMFEQPAQLTQTLINFLK